MVLFYILAIIIFLVVFIGFLTEHQVKDSPYWRLTDEYEKRLPKSPEEWTRSVFGGLIAGAVFGGGIAFVVILIVGNIIAACFYGGVMKNQGEGLSYSIKIVSFEDNHTYIVSRRQTDESDRYYFMRTWDDGYKSGWVQQEDAIIYDADSDYRVDVYQKQYEVRDGWLPHQLVGLFGRDLYVDDNKNYKIYVPKGTIKNDFNVDLQ